MLSIVCLMLAPVSPALVSGSGVPAGTSIDNQATATFQGSAGATTASSNVVHVITSSGAPAVTITKSASQSTANPGDQITYTLNVANIGAGDALPVAVSVDGTATVKIVVRDVIPNNTNLPVPGAISPATFGYHVIGTPQQNYVTAAPGNLATVDAVAFLLDALAAGSNGSFSFKVTIDSNALGVVRNSATVFFNDGTTDTSVLSNEVNITVNGPPPAISYFFDATFSKAIRATPIGAPLWVQVNAAACNVDPTVAETKPVTLNSQLTGDTETFTATETGPNTGIFRILPAVPTRDGGTNPVVSGNGIMEVLSNDQVVASISGCGAASVAATILVDPNGEVFDSRSNAPVPGAQVSLIDVTGAGNGGNPNGPATVFQFDGVTPAPSTVTTAANGRFQFPQVLPSTYRISVKPPNNYVFPSTVAPAQLPAGHNIDPAGSYNGPFVVSVSGGPAVLDIPVDTSSSTSMFIQKTADRAVVELGEFVDYTVEIKNLLVTPLGNAQVNDTLPPGFSYVKKSARLNGTPIGDPAGGKGPYLVFNIGTLAPSADVKLSYRVLVGAGSAMGTNLNRAVAVSGPNQSNNASARVVVQGGVLSDNGFIVGKVFADCNGNRMQDPGEPGVPGVRIYLDDGTFAITDEQGRYSIYGVPGRTHILKVDAYSLPAGSRLAPISNRNAGDGGTRFVDLMFGEMHKADFALAGCSSALADEIKLRSQKLGRQEELARAVKAQFSVEAVQKDSTQLKSMAASGLVDAATPSVESRPANQAPLATDSATSLATGKDKPASADSPLSGGLTSAELAKLDKQLDFVDLKDHDVMSFAQANIRVKGRMDATFKLFVNTKEISAKQVGSKTKVAEKQLEVWEFVGVNLQPGKNSVLVIEIDPFGNERNFKAIELIAPDRLGKLKLDIPGGMHAADGKTPVKVMVRLTDADGVPVTVRTPVTLETTNGTWLVKDLNPNEPGTQVFVEGGHAEFDLMPPIEPGSSMVRVSSGSVNAETKIEYVPELRPMMAAGLVEYQINFGARGHSAIQPSLNDGFEHELRLFSASSGDSFDSGGHAVLLLKGKIKGQNLLTLAYDSDKTVRDRLFRDIQPDQYYPVYGDASVRGYDAQSTSKAYVRIDHGKTYVLYGDYVTSDPGVSNSLGNYSRSLTGVKQHFENDRVSLTGFASYDSATQRVEEVFANGTSGPFKLSSTTGVENSEKVEVLTRDRNQPSVIIDIRPLNRFSDYEFEPFTGELLLKSPIPSLDSMLNPLSIRITYEVNDGGEKFWLGGGTAQVRVAPFLQLGGTFVDDSNPLDPNKLFSVNSVLKLKQTTFAGELAGTDHLVQGLGFGYRFEVRQDGERLKGRAYFSRTDVDFNNPTSIINQGRGESGVKASYAFNKSTRLLGEYIRTEDVTNAGTREGGELGLERTFPGNIQTLVGFRHAQETATPASASTVGVTPNSLNTLISKISMQIPHFNKFTASAEYEQDVAESDKHVVAVGGTYQFWQKGRVYFRQELISSLGDVYSLNTLQHRNTTQFGVESAYYKDARVFSEYRVQDLSNGREAEAVVGLRNNWNIAHGLTANTSVESIRTLNGTDVNSLALTGGVEYTAQKNWKSSGRMEWRGSTNSDSFLNTVGLAARLTDSWTFLGRNILSNITTKTTGGAHLQDRLQFGFALRDTERNRWNGLSMFEFKDDLDNSQPATPVHQKLGILATTANYQVAAPFTLSARYAVKWNVAGSSAGVTGLTSSAATELVGGRATWDVSRKWDFGVAASNLHGVGLSSSQYGMGAETGYQLIGNMWLSVGYNLMGFRDGDLAGEDVTRRGVFVRMRFKFDESIFTPKTKRD